MKYIIIDNNCKINEVKETKLLGVATDNALEWSSHLECIMGKIAKGIGVIIKARKIYSVVTLLSLFNSFIMTYLSYCVHVWGKSYDTYLRNMMSLQNKDIRIIARVPPGLMLSACILTSIPCPVKSCTRVQWACACINSVMICSRKFLLMFLHLWIP